MPIGPGSLLNGVWKYGEDDASGPLFSDFLNKLGDSIRTIILAALLGDTGWTNAVLSGTWAVSIGLTPAYSKLNGVVYTRGQVTGGAPGSTVLIYPAGMRPAATHKQIIPNTDGTGYYTATVTTAGVLTVTNSGTGATPVLDIKFRTA